MGWFWTVLLNAMLALAGYWTARDGLRQPAGLQRSLGAATLAWVWVILGVELTGSFGLLEPVPLLIWTGIGLLISAAFRARRSSESGAIGGESRCSWDLAATLALAVTIWVGLMLMGPSLILPVKVVSDGPIYHLYFAIRWWKEGRLSLIPTPFGASVAPYFPANGDLWLTWLTVVWGGDRLARIGQVPFLLFAGFAAAGLARRLGSGVSSATVAACWAVSSSPLFLYSFEPNVDTIFTAGYLAAAYFFLQFALDHGRADALFLGGLAAGAALGTKAPGILFVPPLLAGPVLLILFRTVTDRRRPIRLALLIGSTLVPSAFWYGRMLWLTGNPLYPLHLEALGRTWLAGWYGTEVMKKSQYYIPRENWRAAVDTILVVFDPRLVPLWIASMAGAWAWGRQTRPDERWAWACSALAILNIGLFWFLVPYRTQQRFLVQALGLAAPSLALLLERSRGIRLLAAMLVAVHFLTPQGWPISLEETTIPWNFSDLVPSAMPGLVAIPMTAARWAAAWSGPGRIGMILMGLLGLGCLVTAWSWGRFVRQKSPNRLGSALLLSSIIAVAAGLLAYPWGIPPRLLYYPSFADYQAGWAALEVLSEQSGTRVAYAGTNLPYYLMAHGLRNETRYINVDSHPGWMLHDYHRFARAGGRPTSDHPNPSWDRDHPDYQAWLTNLRAERIGLLVVARSNPNEGSHNIGDRQGFPIERGWAEEHPETFRPLYGVIEGDPLFRIYRVEPDSGKIDSSKTDGRSEPH